MTGPSPELQAEVDKFEARDLDKRRGGWSGVRVGVVGNGIPDPRKRRCNNCEMEVELSDQWECPTPGCVRHDGKPTQVFWTTEKLDCDHCGAPAFRVWKMNRPGEIFCQCKESPAQKRSRLARERQAKFDQAKRENELDMARKARACWEDMGLDCRVTKLPFDFCRKACARFESRLQDQLRRHEAEQRQAKSGLEFEEIDL